MIKKTAILISIMCAFLTKYSFTQILNKNIKEIVVSSNRAQSNENISNIQIIDSTEIKNAPVQTIEDLLEYAINVDIRQRGGQGVQSDISMRGGSYEQVLVMLNGVKLNDPQTGHHTLNLPVSLEQVQKIEVVTGGSSRVFGNFAYTGAINIITKTKMKNSLNLSRGENGFSNAELNYHIKSNNFTHNFSINHKKSDGYINGMDYDITNFYYQNKFENNNLQSLINYGITKKEFGAFSFYSSKYPNQFEITKTSFASFQLKTKGKIYLDNKLYWRKNNDEFILFRDNPSWYHNFHETNVFGIDVNLVQKTNNGSNVIGMEIRADNIKSNILGEELENPIQIDSSNFYFKGGHKTITNLFIEKNYKLNRISFSTGVMLNIDTKYGNTYFPGIDINYSINDRFKMFVAYNKSMRTPTYTELYYISPTNEGNINLKEEHSTNKEIGFKLRGINHKSNITFYQRKGEDLIDWVLFEGDSIWRTQNISKLTTKGFEISSTLNINNILQTSIPISFLKFNYSFNKNDTTSESFQSAYVLDHLEKNFSIIASQIINKKIRIDWRATYQDRAGGYTEFNSGLEIEYLPFWLIGSKVTYEFSKDKLIYCEVHNLLDETYVDFGNIPQPKRWIRGGIKFIF